MTSGQNYVNHIALVLDASGSMAKHAKELIKVADEQIAYLARRSQELDQETRVTVYTFNSKARCVIYDKDVLRLPSIASFYKPSGQTALVDAALLSQQDLTMTPQKYGDHAFLTFILTDGEENASENKPKHLVNILNGMPDHWTVAVLVPNMRGKHEAKAFGFPADNIAIWDATTSEGVREAGATITRATESFMTGRATGIRGSRALFSTGVDAVNAETVKSLGIKPLSPSQFVLVPVPRDSVIRDFVESTGRGFQVGKAFYQLMKPETIQANKLVAVVEKKTAKVFLGPEARALIGLPDMEVRVRPSYNPDYTIYVQSNSVNRKLIAGTKILLVN